MNRNLVLITLIIFATGALLSGCISINVESKVGRDCKIEYYKISMNMTSYVYDLLQRDAAKKGYSSLRESFYSNISPEYKSHFSYNEIWHGNYVSIIITARDIPPDGKNIVVEKENGNVIYKDYTFDNKNVSSILIMGGAIHYSLEMPGKIIDSNANIVKGNKAEWYITQPVVVYAVSEIPSLGFEAIITVLVIAVVIITITVIVVRILRMSRIK